MTRLVRSTVAAGLLVLLGLAGGCVGRITDSPAPVDQKAPGRWTELTSMPAPRQEVTAAAFFGGFTGGPVRWTASENVYEFIPSRGAWEPRASLPTPRGALAVAVLNGRVHALGGSGESVTNAHEVYDPAANRWIAPNTMPTARDHLAAVAFQGRGWALGGRASFVGEQYANVAIYDPTTDSWRPGPPLPVGRGGLAAAVLRDRIVVFGGEAPLRIFSATEMWEVSGQRWIAKEPMPTPRHGIVAAVIDGRIFVPAGTTEPGFAATTVNEVYVP